MVKRREKEANEKVEKRERKGKERREVQKERE